MAFDLKSIQRTKHKTPPRILIHGGEGAGKSTFLSECPDSIFIQTEDGLNGIDSQAFPLANVFTDVIEQLNVLVTQKHEFKAVWIDSADWLERLIHAKICSDQNVTIIDKASGGFGKGYTEALGLWRQILSGLDILNKEKGMYVGLTCHSRIQHINDPEFEEGFDCYRLKLHSPKSGNGSLELLSEWADIIGFCKIAYRIGESEVAKADVKKLKNVAQDRFLCLNPTAAYLAKNRYSLKEDVKLEQGKGWKSFISHLTKNQ
jgi:hypothetical protein